jgi:hypothetical protein
VARKPAVNVESEASAHAAHHRDVVPLAVIHHDWAAELRAGAAVAGEHADATGVGSSCPVDAQRKLFQREHVKVIGHNLVDLSQRPCVRVEQSAVA